MVPKVHKGSGELGRGFVIHTFYLTKKEGLYVG